MKKEIANQIFNYQIKLCKIWINHFTDKTGKFESRHSYVCKHTVERLFGTYIPREAFEAAAEELGYIGKLRKYERVNKVYKFSEKINANYYGFSLNVVVDIVAKINTLQSELMNKS